MLKVKELLEKEKGLYTVVYVYDPDNESIIYDSVLGYLTDNAEEQEGKFFELPVKRATEMNGVNFTLFLEQGENYAEYDSLVEEQQQQAVVKAKENYDYSLTDRVLLVEVDISEM